MSLISTPMGPEKASTDFETSDNTCSEESLEEHIGKGQHLPSADKNWEGFDAPTKDDASQLIRSNSFSFAGSSEKVEDDFFSTPFDAPTTSIPSKSISASTGVFPEDWNATVEPKKEFDASFSFPSDADASAPIDFFASPVFPPSPPSPSSFPSPTPPSKPAPATPAAAQELDTMTFDDMFKDDAIGPALPSVAIATARNLAAPVTVFSPVQPAPLPSEQRAMDNAIASAGRNQHYYQLENLRSGVTLPILNSPSAPTLVEATLSSLTVQWSSVEHAAGYYLDFFCVSLFGEAPEVEASEAARLREQLEAPTSEPSRMSPPGLREFGGHRLAVHGDTLLRETQATICGLQPHGLYLVRVTAVACVTIAVPSPASSLTPHLELTSYFESAPSPLSAPFRTLHAGAEVARLTRRTVELELVANRVPILEADVVAKQDQIAQLQMDLEAALAEATRLTALANDRTNSLNEANRRIGELKATLAQREATIAIETAENLRLTESLRSTEKHLADSRSEVRRLGLALDESENKFAALSRTSEAQQATIAKHEDTIVVLRQRIKDAQADLRLKDAVRLELLEKLELANDSASGVASEKDVIIGKLTDDLAKVIDELDVTQRKLHAVEDELMQLEPLAKPVLEIRRQQEEWDRQHAAIMTGGTFSRLGAARKLGPRPTLTL